jgi:outer membrane receptor protein involved in Fe transport
MLNYAIPVTSNSIMETGYKGIFRSLDADYETSDKAGNDYIVDTRVSNIYKFNEQIHAAYIQYSGFIGDKDNSRWRYVGGIRAEQVFNNGDTHIEETSFNNKYIHLFPSANLSYYINSDEFWKLSYGKRINYPSVGQLGPFIDITDSLNQHSGNPYLKPEIIHSFELGYNKSWNNYSLTTIAFYRYSKDVIRTYYDLRPGGVVLYLPKNFGSASTFGLDNIFYLHPVSFYDATLSLSLFRLQFDGTGVERPETNDAFGWYCKIVNNFKWNKSKFQLTGNYNSPVVTPQGKNMATYYMDFGFQQQLGKNTHTGIVATDILNTLKSGYTLNTPAFMNHRTQKADTRAILFTFAYTFNSAFKEKLLENRFSREY